jgi:hypothetical protein
MHPNLRIHREIENLLHETQTWSAIERRVQPLILEAANNLAITPSAENGFPLTRLRDEVGVLGYSFNPGFRAGYIIISPSWIRWFFAVPERQGRAHYMTNYIRKNEFDVVADQRDKSRTLERSDLERGIREASALYEAS